MDSLLPLTPLQLAAGYPCGVNPAAAPLPEVGCGDPKRALEEALLAAIQQPPCFVSFSGGRDSSALLAAATQVARRKSLPLPVPTTLRFPGRPETEESDWQELVVRELRLGDWIKHVIEDDELDVVGPVAQSVLRRHGVLWPPNVHAHVPLLADAGAGTLITGFDGDGLFGDWRWNRTASVLFARVRPTPYDALRVLNALAPHAVRTRVALRRNSARQKWLRPEVEKAVARAEMSEQMEEPVRWNERVAWWARRRYLGVACESLRLIAEDAGAQIVHPFLDRHFLAALARLGGRPGFANRTQAMDILFRDALPARLVARSEKARFTSPFWGRYSNDLRERWQGGGVPLDLVDPDRLRREWAQGAPQFSSAPLLQAVWLSESGAGQLKHQVSRTRD